GRRRTPLGRQAWLAVSARYERHRLADGLLPATYDTILLAVRKPGLVPAEPGAPRDE
ncbi:MAG TPA: malonyl-[acyl-carrier protein] O-methyltransferase BioC, partial [Thauera sp.]|nr:malonyl-[acyl-carrier protein] O-methyltransferase BioC [Thauera sp.]